MVHEMRMSATTFAIVTLLVCFLVITLPLPIIVAGTLLVICLSDADLTLTACQWFGKRPQELKGKVVWITGASSGIGEALAYELATIGCKLILSSRREVELERVRQKCVELSPPDFREAHMVMRLDVADYDSHQTCVEEVIAKYSRIDYLVNNAGRSQLAPALDTSLEVDKTILNLNTIGTISLTKAVLPHMVQRKEGLIAFVSSIVGKFGSPYYAIYSASKHALQGYFDALRMELADTNVDVLSICPGPVVSQVIENSLSSQVDKPAPTIPANLTKYFMGTQRCAHLMSVAMVNRLHEVWICRSPTSIMTYIAQYMPMTWKWLCQLYVAKAAKKQLLRES